MVFGKIFEFQHRWMNEIIEENNLSTEGLFDENVHLYSIDQGAVPAAIGALTLEGDIALLRTVGNRGRVKKKGMGKLLVWHILAEAQWKKLKTIYLLTDTAEMFFAKLGFEKIDRTELPDVFNQNILVQKACSTSSTVMKIDVASWKAEYRDVSVMDRLDDDKR
jgi:amino-acid N-acetyltransferase